MIANAPVEARSECSRRKSTTLQCATVSLVIPTWNDADALRKLLVVASVFAGITEIIVADSSQSDACAQVASEFGARYLRCNKPNRGAQMNAGARLANGEVILFHHADTELSAEHIHAVQHAAGGPGFTSGSFYRKFDPAQRRRAWLVPIVRWYNRHFGALYGDQSLFIRREHFYQTGGFKEIALMEDVEYTRRLRKQGIALVDPPIASNGRRLAHRGSLRVTIQNLMIMMLFRVGVSPDRLHAWYYKNKKPLTSPSLAETQTHL